jgi:hypothetical protein
MKTFFCEEYEKGGWKKLEKIIVKIKKIPFEKKILKSARNFEFSFEDNITNLLQCWDSY